VPERTISETTYYLVFGALLALTLTTYGVAYLDIGKWHTAVAMAISVIKMTLIILYFMHARYGNRLTWVVIGAGALWIGILLTLTMGDYLTRGLG
jgi:cytochrome c oxidase subunit IV